MISAKSPWVALFPPLAALPPEALRSLLQGSRELTIPAGTMLFRAGELCENFMLVLDGQVRVQTVGESGREILLYRVESGESCILTTSCLITDEAYSAEGLTETEVHAVVIPAGLFHDLLGRADGFRRFVFRAYATRLADLFALIEEVAFGRIDVRLAACLLARGTAEVSATHQELAAELGSAREVISRQLKDFERRGWVALGRGRIELTDPAALRRIAEKSAV